MLLGSIYCLCPSGSGPNSIRFWEALAVGSIPILLSDTLDLPKYDVEGADGWDETIIRIKESNIETIPTILENISKDEEEMIKSEIESI